MSTAPTGANGPQAFFRELTAAFGATLNAPPSGQDRIAAVLSQSWDSFDGNVAIQSEGQPAVDCHKGCATCCTLRVSATAPEVFLIARFIAATGPAYARAGIDLTRRLHEADAATRGRGEAQRVQLRRPCPFIAQGSCTIYRVRPLACGAYELNHALMMALPDPGLAPAWHDGHDPLAPAAVDSAEDLAAMGVAFDAALRPCEP